MRRIFEGVLKVGTAIVEMVVEDLAVSMENSHRLVAEKIQRNPGLTEKFPDLSGKLSKLNATAKVIRSSQAVRKKKVEDLEKKKVEILNSPNSPKTTKESKKGKSSDYTDHLVAYKSLMEKAEAEFNATGTLSEKMMNAVDHFTDSIKIETKKINSIAKKRQSKNKSPETLVKVKIIKDINIKPKRSVGKNS